MKVISLGGFYDMREGYSFNPHYSYYLANINGKNVVLTRVTDFETGGKACGYGKLRDEMYISKVYGEEDREELLKLFKPKIDEHIEKYQKISPVPPTYPFEGLPELEYGEEFDLNLSNIAISFRKKSNIKTAGNCKS